MSPVRIQAIDPTGMIHKYFFLIFFGWFSLGVVSLPVQPWSSVEPLNLSDCRSMYLPKVATFQVH